MKKIPAIVWIDGEHKAEFRSFPSDDCEEYWCLLCWTQVYVMCLGTIWAKVIIGNMIGYIKRQYLELSRIGSDDSCR